MTLDPLRTATAKTRLHRRGGIRFPVRRSIKRRDDTVPCIGGESTNPIVFRGQIPQAALPVRAETVRVVVKPVTQFVARRNLP